MLPADRFVRQGVLPQFGDYELESEIARGGMGVVYRARQRSLNRTVAIKMILAGQLATPESVQRFRLEAEAAARLHHPGIVPIYEIGEYETQHYFSMKLIEGLSLAECLDDFRLKQQASLAEAREQQQCIAELMARVARALDFAHQRGVLHRDLKPSNILIDEQGEPHLTDFGLAKLTGRESSGLTLSSAVLGTPGYLAPEQAAGRAEISTAADVYGLGATLYELLTGRPPFVGDTAVETMWMAMQQTPTPPRQVNPAVHRDLETIALRCLEKAPEQRYPSAAAVADELERFVRREPIQARPVSLWESAWRWRQRNPWLAGLACSLVLAILAGSGAALWQWGRAERANVVLRENVAHLKWESVDSLLGHGDSSRALAQVAAMLRADPSDWKAAMFAMSVMEQRRFPVPLGPPIRHPDGAELSVARLSPNGSRIVTASYDGTARLWDAETSAPLGPPLAHQGPVRWAEFRPDGSLLATCSEDKSVRLWEVATGAPVGEPCFFEEAVLKVQFDPGGRHLLVTTNRTASVLDGENLGVVIGPLRHEGPIVAAHFVAGGSRFYTAQQAGEDSCVRAWEVAGKQEIANLKTGSLKDADLSEDGSRLVVVDGRYNAWVADFPSGEQRAEVVSPNGRIDGAIFGSRADQIATLGTNHWVRVWDGRSATPVTAELQHYYLLRGAAFLDGGKRLLSWADDSLAQVWDISASQPYCEPMRHTNRVVHAEAGMLGDREVFLATVSHLKSRSAETQTGAAQLWKVHDQQSSTNRFFGNDLRGHDGGNLSPDGRLVAIGKTSQHVQILDTRTGRPVCNPLPVKGGAWGVLFTPDSRRLITTTSRGQVAVWSILEGKPLATPVELQTTIQPAEIANDGKHFATGSTDHIVRLWDTASGQPIREMIHGSEINAIAFSPDGRRLASAGENRIVRLWDAATGNLIHELIGHRNEVMSLCFSPDGRRLSSASLDFSGRIWDANTGREIAVLPHQGEVIDTIFSPDGRWVATASRDRTAVIWEAATGLPHMRPLVHVQGVRNLKFSHDGRQLATLDFRGLRLWDVATCHPLTVHLPHVMFGGTGFQASSGRPSFTPEGKSLFVCMDSEEARLWHLSLPPPSAPAWFPELLEAVAGQRFAESIDRPESVPPEGFLKIERRLHSSQETDYYTLWARRWLEHQ